MNQVVITGATRVVGVIGSPVRHSLSPALHNAAFAAARVPWVYVAFDVAPGRAADALVAVRTLGLGGLSVTMPHKDDIADAVDELDPAAAALHSVNTVIPLPDGRMKGYNTDGEGFVAALREAGHDPAGRHIVVLGAGAAARAVIDALARSGADELVIVNRSMERARVAVSLAGSRGRVGSQDDVRQCDMVVNATSVGLGSNEMPLDPALLRTGQVVADLVYHPLDTALLLAARDVGADTVDGLGMLVHQAVMQQQLWLGSRPDAQVMRAAALEELAARAQIA